MTILVTLIITWLLLGATGVNIALYFFVPVVSKQPEPTPPKEDLLGKIQDTKCSAVEHWFAIIGLAGDFKCNQPEMFAALKPEYQIAIDKLANGADRIIAEHQAKHPLN